MVLLQVVTECLDPAKIDWVVLILLLDKPECQGHIPVELGCQFLDEGDNLCIPSPLDLQALLISPPLCLPPLHKLLGGKMSPQTLCMFCPQLCDCMDWLISVVGQPIIISPLPLVCIEVPPAIASQEGTSDL